VIDPDALVAHWPPGLQHGYSNLTPALSEALIETVSGMRYRDYVAKTVFKPLAMTGAGFDPHDELPGGFRADGRTSIPYWHMAFASFGAMNASVADLSRLVATLIAECNPMPDAPACGGAFAPSATLAARSGLRIGYGLGTYGRVRQGFVFHGHGGDADGYRSRFGVLPHGGRGYAIVINTDNPALLVRMEQLIEAALVADLERPTPPPAVAADTGLARLAGTYYPASTRFALERWQSGALPVATVQVRGPRLVLRRGSRTTELIPLGAGLFRRERDPLATVAFAHFEGSLLLGGEAGSWVRIDPGPVHGFITPTDSQ
jgi:CubicO group peptidase (beta-lactamase class C family)